jgi:hypothetical protein
MLQAPVVIQSVVANINGKLNTSATRYKLRVLHESCVMIRVGVPQKMFSGNKFKIRWQLVTVPEYGLSLHPGSVTNHRICGYGNLSLNRLVILLNSLNFQYNVLL